MCSDNLSKISVPYQPERKMGSENWSKISVPYQSERKMDSENTSKISVLSNNDDGSSLEMKEKDDKVKGTEIVKAIAVVAGLGLAAAWGISKLFGSSDKNREKMKEAERNRETMKAPGRRGHRIYRDDFERHPAEYFRNLRSNK